MANIRFFLLCALISFLALIDIAKPMDLTLDIFSNRMQARSVSEDIVMVSYDASMIDSTMAAEKLLEAGAKGVLTTSPIDALDDPYTHSVSTIYHTASRAEPSVFSLHVEWWRGIESIYGLGKRSNPIELLAGPSPDHRAKSMRIDYALQSSTIPEYSYASVLAELSDVADKQVVLVNLRGSGPVFNVPGQSPANAATILVLAAHTLKSDSLATLPSWLFLIMFSAAYFVALKRYKAPVTFSAVVFVLAITVTFFGLRAAGYYSGLSIAMISIVLIAFHMNNQRKREKSFDSSFRHHSALTDRLNYVQADIIAACIKSYRSFRHGTDPKDMAKFVREVERRLSVAAAGSEIFELEPGVFAWTMRLVQTEELQDHLDAARLILKEPISLGDRQLSLSVSFGVETDRDRPLTDRFDSALMAARDAQRDGQAFKLSNYAEIEAHKEDLLLLGELDDALVTDQIYPVFQPKVCLESLHVVGFEALARWKHPRRGLLSPAVFIPLVENNGKSSLLTRHMLRKSLQVWAELEMTVPVSVNISPTALMADSFVADVQEALAMADLPAELLVLEIVETEALSNNSETEQRLATLCELGIEISIDDFGTGYSTLDNVRRLPAKEIKLDKKFIDDIGLNETAARLVSTTYKMGSELGLSVVAEGIETLEQLAKLQSIGIHVGQGYYFAKPMLSSDIEEYLSTMYRRSQTA